MGQQHHRPARTLVSLVVALATVLGAFLVGASAPVAADASDEATFTGRLNQERTSRGLPALTVRADLVEVARAQARRMAADGTLAHNPSLTSDVTGWRFVGENVGYGPDALTVHAAFMGSQGHRGNILDTDYTEVGIGTVTVNGRVWVAEVFRTPERVATTAGRATTASRTAGSAGSFTRKLVLGSTGADVRRVQSRLGLSATGTYGRGTARAVLHFQRRQGWPGSGNVGPRTWARLF